MIKSQEKNKAIHPRQSCALTEVNRIRKEKKAISCLEVHQVSKQYKQVLCTKGKKEI
jgi:hypothetical protein